MKDGGVPYDEMFNFPGQTRPEIRGLDALLSGNPAPEDAPAGLRPVAEVLAALQASPDASELAGWGRALAAFREAPGAPGTSRRKTPLRRTTLISTLLSAKLAAAAAAAAAAAVGGAAVAAYTGSLPAPLQKVAHEVIGAPSARPTPPAPASGQPVGPDASGSPAYGLCTAYDHGGLSQHSVAFRNLVNAAGGKAKVAAYCASVTSPGAAAAGGRAAGRPSQAPSASRHHGKPSGRPSTAPSGRPTTAPSGRPSPVPSHSHGKP
jgi:hypothetical protein